MKIDLSGKTAVVTGATGQLGRTMARKLAECGAAVGLCYYSKGMFAEELKKELEENYGVKSAAVQADVTDFDSVQAMQKEMAGALGPADIIVNNAVIQLPAWKTVIEQPLKDYESQFKSCVMQNVHMAKAFVRGMDGVFRVLAKETGPYNITVNQVAPGWTLSDSCRDHDGSEHNINQSFPYVERVPMERRGTDDDIANAVCFLASDLAGFITGAFLPVTGGNVMVSV